MAENKSFSTQQEKRSLAEKLWLAYFNAYLYEQGMITESQRNRMLSKIDNRKGSTYEKLH
ncbi:MAG: hypothetical protein IKA47_10975 [Oscillospiraceae bacterium]|nr:hypothetical protein [Oscillospiraceae bacterium]